MSAPPATRPTPRAQRAPEPIRALAADKKLASTEFVLTVLLQGQRSMPPVGRMMSDEQVADVVNYVRTHFGNSYPGAASAAQVAAARLRTATPP